MNSLTPGSKFIIREIPKKFMQRMLAFGIKRNVEVTICRVAPFNGLIQLKIGNLSLGLRQSDFKQLVVEDVN